MTTYGLEGTVHRQCQRRTTFDLNAQLSYINSRSFSINFALEQAIKALRGSIDIALLFL